jgi:hypothetical protein
VDISAEAVDLRATRIERYAEQRRDQATTWPPGSALNVEVLAHAATIAGDAAALRALAAERDELRAREQRRWDATQRGIKAWQDKNPGRERAWPDFADMVTWLLEDRDRIAAENARLRAFAEEISTTFCKTILGEKARTALKETGHD